MDIQIEKVTIDPNKRKLQGVWTVEECQDTVSTVGSSVYEDLAPAFFKEITEVLGHDCWFTKTENGVESICTGDPLGEYILDEYPLVDGKISKDNVKHPLLEEQIAELVGDEGNYEYAIVKDKLVVTNKNSRITEEYKIVCGNELIKPTCPYCRTPIECLDTYWDDHVTCDND